MQCCAWNAGITRLARALASSISADCCHAEVEEPGTAVVELAFYNKKKRLEEDSHDEHIMRQVFMRQVWCGPRVRFRPADDCDAELRAGRRARTGASAVQRCGAKILTTNMGHSGNSALSLLHGSTRPA